MGHFEDLTARQAKAVRDAVAAIPRPAPNVCRPDVVCCTFGRPAQPCSSPGHAARVTK